MSGKGKGKVPPTPPGKKGKEPMYSSDEEEYNQRSRKPGTWLKPRTGTGNPRRGGNNGGGPSNRPNANLKPGAAVGLTRRHNRLRRKSLYPRVNISDERTLFIRKIRMMRSTLIKHILRLFDRVYEEVTGVPKKGKGMADFENNERYRYIQIGMKLPEANQFTMINECIRVLRAAINKELPGEADRLSNEGIRLLCRILTMYRAVNNITQVLGNVPSHKTEEEAQYDTVNMVRLIEHGYKNLISDTNRFIRNSRRSRASGSGVSSGEGSEGLRSDFEFPVSGSDPDSDPDYDPVAATGTEYTFYDSDEGDVSDEGSDEEDFGIDGVDDYYNPNSDEGF